MITALFKFLLIFYLRIWVC